MMNRRLFCAVTAAAALASSALSPLYAADKTKVTVAIVHPSMIALLPVTAALGEGYFDEEGLDVDVQAVNGSAAVLQAMAAGQAQIGNPGAGPFIAAVSRGLEATFIHRTNPNNSFSIAVLEKDGIQSLDALKGKVVGIGTADGAEVAFARSLLKDSGLAEEGKDYTFLVVGDGGQAAAAFSRGDIQAYVSSTTDSAIITHRGLALRPLTLPKYQSFFGNGFAVMNSYLDQNAETLEKWGRAVVRGSKFAFDPANEEKMLDHIAKISPQEGEDRGFAKALMQQIKIRQTPILEGKGFGYQGHEEWVAWQDSMLEAGELSAPLPDISKIYTNRFVDAWNADK